MTMLMMSMTYRLGAEVIDAAFEDGSFACSNGHILRWGPEGRLHVRPGGPPQLFRLWDCFAHQLRWWCCRCWGCCSDITSALKNALYLHSSACVEGERLHRPLLLHNNELLCVEERNPFAYTSGSKPSGRGKGASKMSDDTFLVIAHFYHVFTSSAQGGSNSLFTNRFSARFSS